jgi:hypothetical protein
LARPSFEREHPRCHILAGSIPLPGLPQNVAVSLIGLLMSSRRDPPDRHVRRAANSSALLCLYRGLFPSTADFVVFNESIPSFYVGPPGEIGPVLTPSLHLPRVVPVAFSWSLCLESLRVISLALLSFLPPPRGSSDTTLRRQTVPIDTYRMYTAEFSKSSQIFLTRNYSLTPSVKRAGGQDHVRVSRILHRHQRASLRYSLSLHDTVVPLEIDSGALIFMQVILQ